MKEIALTCGAVALVDDEDFERVNAYRWYLNIVNPSHRVQYARSGTVGHMHRFLLDAPRGMDVDHINHDGLDNRRANLRLCTRADNIRNGRKHRNGKTSRFKGVSWSGWHHTWRATLMLRRRQLFLGYFANEIDAAHAYNRAAEANFGEFACLNVIEEAH